MTMMNRIAMPVLDIVFLSDRLHQGERGVETRYRRAARGNPARSFPYPRRREMMAEKKRRRWKGDTMKKQIIIDSNGFLSVPDNFRLTFLMEQATLDFIEDAAVRIAKVDSGNLLMAILVGEQMDPEQPIYIIAVDPDDTSTDRPLIFDNERGESFALIATQDSVKLTDPVGAHVYAHAGKGQ
jgi:hypothetical protein